MKNNKMIIYLKEVFGFEKREKIDPNKNYCLDCGACCTYFKVLISKEESNEFNGNVPKEYLEKYDKNRMNLIGRNNFNDQTYCKALEGSIGINVKCNIYENRPNVCKEFQAVSSDGMQNIRCMKARKSAGLDPYLK
jgi:Fe-S-cluster containining protein